MNEHKLYGLLNRTQHEMDILRSCGTRASIIDPLYYITVSIIPIIIFILFSSNQYTRFHKTK